MHLLIIEHDIWAPDVVRGHVEHLNAAVLAWLPGQLVVVPTLQRGNQTRESCAAPESRAGQLSTLTCSTQRLVVII